MQKRIVLGTLVVCAAAGSYFFRPDRLFIDKTVNESLDAYRPASAGSLATEPVSANGAPVTLVAGRFHRNAHETSGNATVLDVGAGRRILRLTDFATSNGPDVRVYLVAADDVNDDETVKRASFMELGP